jgi:hypothetical protein
VARIRAALRNCSHKTTGAWRALRARIRALSDEELTAARELEKLGKRRTEHLKLMDNERRRRQGDTADRTFKVVVGQ